MKRLWEWKIASVWINKGTHLNRELTTIAFAAGDLKASIIESK